VEQLNPLNLSSRNL